MGRILGGLFWSFALIIYVIWIFVSTDGEQRMKRACTPVEWTGNVTTSLVSIVIPSLEIKTENAFKKVKYSCEFTLWRLFYEKDYLTMLEKQKKAEELKNAKKTKDQKVIQP